MNEKTVKTEPSGAGKMFGTAAIMAIIVVCSKGLGLLRDILTARAFGTGVSSQAYEIASALPITIFDFIVGGVVSAAFIPVFAELLVKKSKQAAMKFASSYINLILLITGAVSVLGIIFAHPLVSALAPGESAEVLAEAAKLTRIMFPMVIFCGMAFSFVGILQSLGEFRIPALISLVSNVIMVAYLIFFGDRFGVVGLSVAMILGWVSQAAVQIPMLRKLGFRYELRSRLGSPEIKTALFSAFPILVGTWTQPICSVINKAYASGMNGGRAISALSYANKLYIIIVGVFAFVATNLLFPYMSRANAAGEEEKAKQLMLTSVKILIFIIAPISIGILLLADPFIALVYERGEFTAQDTVLTATALRGYAVGMLFMSVNEVLTKAFFSEKRVIAPMVSSVISMGANIVAIMLFAEKMGVFGVALMSALATVLNCAINYCVMHRREKMFALRDWLDVGRSLLSAAVMGAAVWFSYSFCQERFGKLLTFAIPVVLGVLVYAVVSLLIGSEEWKPILKKLRRK